MPSAKTHIVFAVITTIGLSILYLAKIKHIGILPYIQSNPWWVLPLSFILVFIGSILPDLDHPNSLVRWIVTVLGLVAAMVAVWFNKKIYALSILGTLLFIWLWKLTHKLGHRGWIHTLLAAVVFSFPLFFFIPPIFVGIFFYSYFTHLTLDFFIKRTED